VKAVRLAKSTVMKRIALWGLQDVGRDTGRAEGEPADDGP